MRIKIEGQITAERLAEALDKAAEKFPANRQPHFYGANLYLSVFTADGVAIELVDDQGQPVIVRLPAPPGTQARPALTSEGAELLKQAKNKVAADRAAAKLEAQRQDAIAHEHVTHYRKRCAAAKRAWDLANETTTKLMSNQPEEFVARLNKIVHEVWLELNPVEAMGKRKGESKAMPVFSSRDGVLTLDTAAWKTPKQVRNPIYMSQRHDRLNRYWTHSAWAEACSRIEGLLQVSLSADTGCNTNPGHSRPSL